MMREQYPVTLWLRKSSYEHSFCSEMAGVSIPALLLSIHVTLSKLLNLSVPQLPPLSSRNINIPTSSGFYTIK